MGKGGGRAVSDLPRLGARRKPQGRVMTVAVPPPPPFPPADRADAALESIVAPFAAIAGFRHEVAIFAYLDPNWRLLGMRRVSSGLADSLVIHVRDVVADALFFDAAAVAMAHNHPTGPSYITFGHAQAH